MRASDYRSGRVESGNACICGIQLIDFTETQYDLDSGRILSPRLVGYVPPKST